MNKKVSVIMPLYNLGKYKKLCIKSINSIISQSYKNWELIIIDDYSTDGTYKYIFNYLQKIKNNKIKLLRNPKNYGCYITLNKGIQSSSGDYITRLDADDTFHINKLKIQCDILEKNKDKVCSYASYTSNKNRLVNFAEVTAMYRKCLFDKIGYFDAVRFGADSEFKERIIMVFGLHNIHIIDTILYFVYRRPNSLITSKTTGTKLYSDVGHKKRSDYVKRYKKWHNTCKKLYIEHPLKNRKF